MHHASMLNQHKIEGSEKNQVDSSSYEFVDNDYDIEEDYEL